MQTERTKLLQVRVNEAELATLRTMAAAEDLAVSQLVRRILREAAERRNESAPPARVLPARARRAARRGATVRKSR
jgi:hypothetical protein